MPLFVLFYFLHTPDVYQSDSLLWLQELLFHINHLRRLASGISFFSTHLLDYIPQIHQALLIYRTAASHLIDQHSINPTTLQI
jgi:hypothetical protein